MTRPPENMDVAHPGTFSADPELMALPAPPEGRRVWVVGLMLCALAASLAFLSSTLPEVRYYLQSGEARALGAATKLEAAALVPGRYVTVEGTPMLSTEVGYSRLWGGAYRVFALAGQRTVFVQVPLAKRDALSAQRRFSGRLVTFGELGSRFAPVARFLAEGQGLPVSGETFLLVADEPPSSYVASFLMFLSVLGFVLFDVIFLWRWFLPLPNPHNPVPS